jgi:rRNA maturation protein Rpf1
MVVFLQRLKLKRAEKSLLLIFILLEKGNVIEFNFYGNKKFCAKFFFWLSNFNRIKMVFRIEEGHLQVKDLNLKFELNFFLAK